MSDNNDIRKQKLSSLETERENINKSLYYKNDPSFIKDGRLRRSAAEALKNADSQIAGQKAVMQDEATLMEDMQAAESNVSAVLGDAGNLGRIREDAAVIEAQNAYKDSTDLRMQRDQATRQLQAAEGSQSRQLASALSSAGVKGGAAGAAYTDLASMNLRNRSALEQDLAVQNVQATKERAQFETQLAQFDLGQSNAEKNLRLQTKLGLAQQSQLSRSSASQEERVNQIGSKGGGGTVLCTAMYHHGFINKDDFFYDVQAGRQFLYSKKTRKAFLLYNKVCAPIANFAVKHRWFAFLISPVVVPVAKHFNDKNKLGKFLFAVLSAPFKLAAKVL